jgi:HSP20 family protein
MAQENTEKSVKQATRDTEGTRPGRVYRPNVDIGETRNGVWMAIDVPGVDENSVEVGFDDGVLSIAGRVSIEDYQDLQPVYTEYNVGDFERRFRLSNQIDARTIEARIENGVLHLFLPKAEEARPRTIPVQAG